MSFDAAFRDAVDVLVTLDGEAGTFTPAGGSPVAVVVIRRRVDEVSTSPWGGPGHRSPGWTAILRQSEVALRPRSDDLLVIGAERFSVRDVEEDPESTIWTVTLNRLG